MRGLDGFQLIPSGLADKARAALKELEEPLKETSFLSYPLINLVFGHEQAGKVTWDDYESAR